ncbi:pseudouridine synthase [Virgibacillus dakarensis]|uniref:Pseudouridine synthase n=1 Tax=Lentibacillus populi TaxID=1827502 RepID=A0A9W5TVL9_9BACI|nr:MULTISPECIES: pseudouridine synthase [Bacillaceae]MBT2214308.1 rRNA pseudouridine synthase [Virgibacillus dakarensis]MTW84985.1 pseudouridine synthase [Virgibacillus dakarensis]GGB33816.1 ribosomal large subunit pseudouridine synthase B [Lentibacillus populi]
MTNKFERLQKVIAKSGVTSRRKAEQLITDGKVKVNGSITTELGTKVSTADEIEVNGVPLQQEALVYYMLYKPRGVISSVKDDKNRKVVTDFFPGIQERIFPIGRLDYDSSGIILLTNDGEFANHLMHPRYGIEKVYVAKVKGIPSKPELNKLRKGIKVDRDILKAVGYKFLSTDKDTNTAIIEITLQEGKNRHIRRMMEQLGYPVTKLKRERYGVLTLKGLKPGESRPLTPHEVKMMRQQASKIVE